MTGFEVYKMYLALRMHFTNDKYDYIKYRGKVNASEKSFEERRDRYFFKKLATKYEDNEILNYFVANFMHDPKGYIKSFTDDNYTSWKIKQESFSYKFRQEVDFILTDFDAPYQDKFDKIWVFAELVLFVLVGAAVDIRLALGVSSSASSILSSVLLYSLALPSKLTCHA